MIQRFILLFITLAAGCVSVAAQGGAIDLYINPATGRVWYDASASSLDNAILNQTRQSQLQLANFNSAMTGMMVRSFLLENAGRAKVNGGKATTRFAAATNGSAAEVLAAKAATAEQKQQTKQMATVALQTFNEVLKAKRFTPNDMADGKALALVLSFLVYNDQDPGAARLQKMRNWYRAGMMKDLIFQGTPDKEKQREYESLAIRTMLAVRGFQLAKQTKLSKSEKQIALEAAKNYADSVLDELWDGPVAGIELTNTGYGFGDKGERLAKTGNGTTVFRSARESAWAKRNATCYAKDRITELRGDVSCFYEMRDRFDAEVKTLGGQTNDLAYGNAVAFKFLYEVYKGVKLNNAQFRWVLSEMEKDIKGGADFQGMSDEQKQGIYDSLVYRSLRIYDDYTTAKRAIDNPKYKDYAGLGEGYAGVSRMESAGARAIPVLYDIFAPRALSDYELRANGFVRVK